MLDTSAYSRKRFIEDALAFKKRNSVKLNRDLIDEEKSSDHDSYFNIHSNNFNSFNYNNNITDNKSIIPRKSQQKSSDLSIPI